MRIPPAARAGRSTRRRRPSTGWRDRPTSDAGQGRGTQPARGARLQCPRRRTPAEAGRPAGSRRVPTPRDTPPRMRWWARRQIGRPRRRREFRGELLVHAVAGERHEISLGARHLIPAERHVRRNPRQAIELFGRRRRQSGAHHVVAQRRRVAERPRRRPRLAKRHDVLQRDVVPCRAVSRAQLHPRAAGREIARTAGIAVAIVIDHEAHPVDACRNRRDPNASVTDAPRTLDRADRLDAVARLEGISLIAVSVSCAFAAVKSPMGSPSNVGTSVAGPTPGWIGPRGRVDTVRAACGTDGPAVSGPVGGTLRPKVDDAQHEERKNRRIDREPLLSIPSAETPIGRPDVGDSAQSRSPLRS